MIFKIISDYFHKGINQFVSTRHFKIVLKKIGLFVIKIIEGILLSILLLQSSVFAENNIKIKKIEISGNKNIETKKLLNQLDYVPGDDFSYKNFNENLSRILDYYKKKGFYFAKIENPKVIPDKNSNQVIIQIKIHERRRVRIASINFKGNKYFSDQKLHQSVGIHKNDLFDPAEINQSMKTIISMYSEKGYPFCEIGLDTLALKDRQLQVYFDINENKLMRIRKLNFAGNKITKDRTLKLILNLEEDAIYKQSRINAARRNLLNKRYISNVTISPVNSSNLLVRIQERSMNNFQGVLGMSSEDESTFGEKLTGFLDFNFLNIMGTDREIHIKWQHLKQNSSLYDLNYREPFLFGEQISGEISLKRRNIDTLFVQTDFATKLEFLLQNYNTIGVGYLRSSSLQDTNKTSQSGFSLDYGLKKLDYPLNPHSGFDLDLYYKLLWESKSKYQQKVSSEAQVVIPLSLKTAFSLKAITKLTFPHNDTLNKYELYEFGGYENLRGFIDNQFKSEKFSILLSEYRYLLSRSSRVFLFYDIAFCEEYNSLFSLGFGFRFKTKIGLLKIDYGIGHQNNTWTNPLAGTIHFGIETNF